jgi:hypothetical protein
MVTVRATDVELVALGDRLEAEPSPACVLGPAGDVLFTNGAWRRAARVRGRLAAVDVTGRRWVELVGPERRAAFAFYCDRARAGAEVELPAPEDAPDLPECRLIRLEPLLVGGVGCVLAVHVG